MQGYALTGFWSVDLLGDPSESGTDVGHSLAFAAASPVRGRFATFGEIAGLLVPEEDAEQYLATFGVTYNPSTFLVFDAGISVGLNDEAPDAVFLIGFTENLGRIRRR